MNSKQTNVPVVIPPALDADESELAARNEFLIEPESFDEITNADEAAEEIVLDETDASPGSLADEREAKNLRRAKRRKSFAFLGVFGAGFGALLLFLAWAFGFGFFAPPSRIAVDRNQKTNGVSSTGATTSGDEKLKTALALVAGETGNNKDAPVISDASLSPNAAGEQDLKLTSSDKTTGQPNNAMSGNMIVLPDENGAVKSNQTQNQIRNSQPVSQGIAGIQPNFLNGEVAPTNSLLQPKANYNAAVNSSDKADGAIARSVFFGSVFDKNNSVRQNSPTNSGNFSPGRISSKENANVPSFGSLLPVRFLGAIYTLRGAGGLVRMELVRSVKKDGFSYPAGTIIVGRLRGSEYNRAFISVIGAIDAKTGKLVKFEGEVLGIDGASGAKGERKSIKSWGARFLSGLREAGGQAVNVLAARGVGGGRGGTIVLNGSGGLGGEVSSIVRGDTQDNSFVMVRAGTEAYVLITDLPAEQRGDGDDDFENLANSNNQIPGMNLSESEMAQILSTDDPDKLRAALLKMSPQFRALAIKAIEEGK